MQDYTNTVRLGPHYGIPGPWLVLKAAGSQFPHRYYTRTVYNIYGFALLYSLAGSSSWDSWTSVGYSTVTASVVDCLDFNMQENMLQGRRKHSGQSGHGLTNISDQKGRGTSRWAWPHGTAHVRLVDRCSKL